MKKFILLSFLFCAFAFVGQGQNRTIYDVLLTKNDVLNQYRATAADTVTTNKTTFSFTIFNEGQSSTKESFTNYWEIALDSVSGSPTDSVKIQYQRRKNVFTTWTTDSTQYFKGSQSDTTLVYYDTSAKPDPYRRVLVTNATSFKAKIDWLSGLFLLE